MISVVIPVLNESENIVDLIAEIKQASMVSPITEIVVVDDASTDNTIEVVKKLFPHEPKLKILSHDQRAGQSAALRTGIRAATNEWVVTMDGDGQNNPADIQKLFGVLQSMDQSFPMLMVAGQREKRIDSNLKKFTSRAGNFIRGSLLNDGIRDTGCSLKLFRRDDFLILPFFNHIHRYLPALFLREYGTIKTVDVSHRARQAGQSKYGFWDRALAGAHDLIGVTWLLKRKSVRLMIKEL
jgi:dolichol-phosphate mannosyltransferase